MVDIVLAGVQASGKGTQADFLKDAGYQVIGMGDAIRRFIGRGCEDGEEMRSAIEKGHLVSDEQLRRVLHAEIEALSLSEPILFDGFPRNLSQLEIFYELMTDLRRDFTAVLIDLDRNEAMRRIKSRLVCTVCHKSYSDDISECPLDGGALRPRNDDADLAAVERRIEIFEKDTLPVFESFEKEGKLIKINGMQSIEEVKTELFSKLQFND